MGKYTYRMSLSENAITNESKQGAEILDFCQRLENLNFSPLKSIRKTEYSAVDMDAGEETESEASTIRPAERDQELSSMVVRTNEEESRPEKLHRD